MKKKIMFLTLTAFITLLMFSIGTKTLKAADLGDVDVLIANPGEDSSTQMNFSFHTNVSGVVVEVAKKSDGNFDKAIKITPECIPHAEAYPLEGTNWGVDYGKNVDRKTMNVCEAYATGLEPDTEYMYRVGATKFSETRYFKTAGDDGVFVFAVMADPQIYAESMALVTVNENMNEAWEHAQKEFGMDIELVLGAGDMVTQGGIIDHWRWLFDIDLYTKVPLAGSTGNHDYCDAGNGKVTIGSYLTDNAYNHPKNAPEGYTEGVYWFKWNSVLFITLDSETGTTGYHEQMVWFKEVMETVPHQYCVVMCHRPAWGSGDSDNVAKIWTPIFKEYNVDLFFAGHNHDYNRGGVMNVGANRGQKNFPGNFIAVDDCYNASNGEANKGGYCLIKVTPQGLQYLAYDQDKNIRERVNFVAQRPFEANASFDKASFMENLKIEVVETDTTKAKLEWTRDAIGAVKIINILDNTGKNIKRVFTNSYETLDVTFGGLKANTEYTGYKVEVEFMDGTKETKEVSFKTEVDYGMYKNIEVKALSSSYRFMVNADDIKAHLLEKINVYVNGELKTSIEPDAKFAAVDKALITGVDEKIELKGVVASSKVEVLVGVYQFGQTEQPKPELTVETEKLELVEGNTGEIKASATENGKVVYTSSDATVAKVDANGKVTALKAGEATITVTVEGTEEKKEVKVVVEAKPHEHNFVEGKCECGETDPNYEPPHVHNFVEGKCECGETDPNYEPPHVHNFVEGKCECGETDPNYKPEVKPEPAGGCKGGAIQNVFYLISALGLAFVLRKKRF